MVFSDLMSLQCERFQDIIIDNIQGLKEQHDFSDVTLACKDNQTIRSHKFILSAFSPVLRNILKVQNHPNPIIFMFGVEHKTLESLLDFIYLGEVKISQAELGDFFSLAKDLDLKGFEVTKNIEEHFFQTTQPENLIQSELEPCQIYSRQDVPVKMFTDSDSPHSPTVDILQKNDTIMKTVSDKATHKNTLLNTADNKNVKFKEIQILDHNKRSNSERLINVCGKCGKSNSSKEVLWKHFFKCKK